MTARIRAAAIAELDELQDLMHRATGTMPDYRGVLQMFSGVLDISQQHIAEGRILVAERDGRLIGFVAWRPLGDTTAELHGIFIDPECWYDGIEISLIEAVCAAVSQSGLRNLYALVVPEALEFYRHYGFVRTGVTATPIGPVQTMIKELASR